MTGAWNPEKVAVFREQFLNFLNYVKINSKERGQIVLGDEVYRAQMRFLDGIFDGLSNDIHDFKVLKSRQLGISTLARALTLFWIGIHPGLKGYLVLDTSQHSEEARLELATMVQSLPPSLNFPRVKRINRYLLELTNGSTVYFASAGVRAGKTSGTLGRSSGINFVHASEMCSWENDEGLESFKNALAEDFPDRLYIWESTARGFNIWHEMWNEAKEDSTHQHTTFLGWYHKDSQKIERSHPDFDRYGIQPPSADEATKIAAVKEQYDWDVTPEQLAWYRRKIDPNAKPDGDAPAEWEGSGLKIQEQPWTEQESFQQTGATFFDPIALTDMTNKFVNRKYKTYTYGTGIEFVDSRIYPALNARSVQLKVWEEPEQDAVYIISADPAFGANEHNDRSCCQVLRCYADGLDQVAEYAWPLVNTRQFAWVIASLLGHYSTVGGTGKADVYLIVELNGPGEAVWNELKSLKHQISTSYTPKQVEDAGLRNMFQNVKNYIYNRADSMGPGHNWMWKTQGPLKISIMERLRDFTSNLMLRIRSYDTIEEMKSIAREGDSIEAQGSKKDDRVMALAFAVRCWEDRVRKPLIAMKRTRDNEEKKKILTIKDQTSLFMQNQLDSFFAMKSSIRRKETAMLRRQSWRGRR